MVLYSDLKIALIHLENWLKTQLHLPIIEKIILRHFIQTCDGDLEKCKKLININYTMRNTYSQIFMERDPHDVAFHAIFESIEITTMPKLTPDGSRIHVLRINDLDPSKHNFNDCVRVFFMCIDIQMLITDKVFENQVPIGEISIFDMKNFTLKHLAKWNLTTLRIFMRFLQEAYASRISDIHLINVPIYLDKCLALIKPFINADVFKLMQFHTPNSLTLYEQVPKELLPNDYGGQAGTMSDLKLKIYNLFKEKRDYLISPKYWQIDETKRPANEKCANQMEGNFRKLDFD